MFRRSVALQIHVLYPCTRYSDKNRPLLHSVHDLQLRHANFYDSPGTKSATSMLSADTTPR
jgi:hypothetical protein